MEESFVQDVDLLRGAVAFRDLCQARFGPTGGKVLIISDDDYLVTSDLHRLLDEIGLDHPAARLIASGAVRQKEAVGDGSLTVALLAGGLAQRAHTLLSDGFHRATIVQGFTRAQQVALEHLPHHSRPLAGPTDPALQGLVQASLATDLPDLDEVSGAIIEAATLIDRARRARNRQWELDDIRFRHISSKAGPTVELIQGAVLDAKPVDDDMSINMTNPAIAIIGGGRKAGTGIEERSLKREGGSPGKGRTEVTVAGTSLTDIENLRGFETADVDRQVTALVDAGVDAVFCTMGISDAAKARLREVGITAFRALESGEARFLARATGANVVMHLEAITAADLGQAGTLRVVTEGDGTYVRIEGCSAGNAATLLVAGAVTESIEEFERDLRTGIVSAVDALDGGRVVPGGGGIEVRLAQAVRGAARAVPDRRAVPMEAYADALEDIPRSLATNAGKDAIDVLTTLHARDGDIGFESRSATVTSVVPDGPQLPERVIRASLTTATGITTQLVRIDEVRSAAVEDNTITDVDFRPKPGRDD